MINGKKSYLFTFNTQDEVEALEGLIKRVTGKDASLHIPGEHIDYGPTSSAFIEVSEDLQEYKTTILTGMISHHYYPASRVYLNNVYGFIDWYEHHYLVLKDYSIIKHIPHASIEVPDGYWESLFLLDESKFHYYNLKMSDIGVDGLFKWLNGVELKAPYSRLYCDVERNKNKKEEPMERYGLGYKYTKFFDGKNIYRCICNGRDYSKDIDTYYNAWHKKLNSAVKQELEKGKKVLIVDIHSYSDEIANKLGNSPLYPDVCISFNEDFNYDSLVDLIVSNIKKRGLSYRINYPCEGSICPSDYIGNKDVVSIKISINKRLYL